MPPPRSPNSLLINELGGFLAEEAGAVRDCEAGQSPIAEFHYVQAYSQQQIAVYLLLCQYCLRN